MARVAQLAGSAGLVAQAGSDPRSDRMEALADTGLGSNGAIPLTF